ncbi:MAG: hypothetical protein E4G94_12080 [ANME-2 cluster archaeon]|nr:MAG: hypothetical protein E4G94_12080 [ANME-2 cluster archaeon]
MRKLLDDNKGQAIPVEYILIFTISILFFGIILLTFNTVIDQSSSQAIKIEMTDVGNEISSVITKSYLTSPTTGINSLTMDIPTHIAGTGYFIEISDENENPFETNIRALKLTSMRKSFSVFVPLNSVEQLIEVNGTVSSASGKIKITSNTTTILLNQG